MATDHRAEAVWYGDLTSGHGTIERVTTGAFGNLPVTWSSRAERVDENTSPEELIAAAHASCFAMAFSNILAKAGTPPEELRTAATVTFVGGTGITKIALEVTGRVPGIDEEAFIETAEDAKANCPVSKALTGVGEITVEATLESLAEHRNE
jgi:osmotically inducible protein OsmC